MATLKTARIVFVAFAFSVLTFFPATYAQRRAPTAKTVEVINVGISEYSKIERTYRSYERLFRELTDSADATQPVSFRFALGTYGEVRDWYNKGLIDVAVLSAMPVADLMLAGESSNLRRSYIGELSVSAQRSLEDKSVLNLFSDRLHDPFYYRAGCLFNLKDKELEKIQNSDDPFAGLKQLWDDGRLRFLFVRPYSLSGYIVPVSVLKQHGIDPLTRQQQMEFTYEHKNSLKQLIEWDPTNPMHHIAFVLDDSRYDKEKGEPERIFGRIRMPAFRRPGSAIDSPGVDDYVIPREVVLANYHQERNEVSGKENKFTRTKTLMTQLFNSWLSKVEAGKFKPRPGSDDPLLYFQSRAEWLADYDEIKKLLENFSVPRQLLYKATLDDLLNDVIKANPSRLAVVLSGGGAKCAYQAGAMVEIEAKLREKLAQKRSELLDNSKGKDQTKVKAELDELAKKLEIKLVVGTSGGAINALLVAMGVTKHKDASEALGEAWRSFKQQQFLKPSLGFRIWFGFCFGVLQALAVIIAVLLFGRQAMNWFATIIVLAILGALQLIPIFYFGLGDKVFLLLAGEAIALVFVIAFVLIFGRLIDMGSVRKTNRADGTDQNTTNQSNPSDDLAEDPLHWRKLTIVILIFLGVLEALIAMTPGLETLIDYLPQNHWVEHAWTASILASGWSYPFPLLIGILIAVLGWPRMPLLRKFSWLRWRTQFVAWTAIFLVVICALFVLHGLFKASSPSGAEGIEEAFANNVPVVIQKTIRPKFADQQGVNETRLESISRQIITDDLLERDLVITSSKLPVTETSKPLPVNSLPDDLYFYYRKNNDDTLRPPPDKRFVPLRYNETKLLDVVIGSSTIYPIFPARTLHTITTGNEESAGATIDKMRIIDGGFIHNIPIEAAKLWGATHIIIIEASPAQQPGDPTAFWEHALTAFGYLFTQAQRTDTEGPRVEAFLIRPTSQCEKFNIKPVCIGKGKDERPEPDMDTFDFSKAAADGAFKQGVEDVKNRNPLFVRIPGAPNFQEVSPRSIQP